MFQWGNDTKVAVEGRKILFYSGGERRREKREEGEGGGTRNSPLADYEIAMRLGKYGQESEPLPAEGSFIPLRSLFPSSPLLFIG